MSHTYIYQISDFPTNDVDASGLHNEIMSESTLSPLFAGIDSYDSSIQIWFDDDLSPDQQTTLSGIIDVHPGAFTYDTDIHIPISHTHYSYSDLLFTDSPTYNGEIRLLGWYIKTNDAGPYDLSSGNPITTLEPGYHSHWVMNVLTVSGTPFTVVASGTRVYEVTGVYAEMEEEITVTGTGYYQTSSSFIDASTFSISEAGKACTMDIYRTTYWDAGNKDFVVEGCRIEWEPDQTNWYFNLKIYHHLSDGSLHPIDIIDFADTDEYPRASQYEPGKYKRIDYNTPINGNDSEGLVIYLDQDAIKNFYLEIRYSMETTVPPL